MTSITMSTHGDEKDNDLEEKQLSSTTLSPPQYPSNPSQYVFQWSTSNQAGKTSRASSCNEEKLQSAVASGSSNHNRFKHLCTRLKRRFSISKDYRTTTEDANRGLAARFRNYKSFSSSIEEDSDNDYDWPDFEKIYDAMPHCLVKALPGLDDFSIENDDENNSIDTTNFLPDENEELAELFECCKRGKNFRRNAICRRLDKSQYRGQLDTFIQQLMIEKLMRTWT